MLAQILIGANIQENELKRGDKEAWCEVVLLAPSCPQITLLQSASVSFLLWNSFGEATTSIVSDNLSFSWV